jgi:hypothetical protein
VRLLRYPVQVCRSYIQFYNLSSRCGMCDSRIQNMISEEHVLSQLSQRSLVILRIGRRRQKEDKNQLER